jgi:hypothetical protein
MVFGIPTSDSFNEEDHKQNSSKDGQTLGKIGIEQHFRNILFITVNRAVFHRVIITPEIIGDQLQHNKRKYGYNQESTFSSRHILSPINVL